MAIFLYIEDNESIRQLVQIILSRRSDIVFLGAETGEAGLIEAFAKQPDIILVDITLPDISGSEVLQKLRNNPITSSTPVLAISGNSVAETRTSSPGFNDYLAKPIDIAALYATIDRLLK